jgi:threonyl-tRNA synthetase
MLHRALYGSLERFMGILLEHHGGSLPPWLAPEQVVILPIGADQHDAARDLLRALAPLPLRASLDARDESLSRRIAEAHERAIPFAIVIGRREIERRSVSLRSREGQHEIAADAIGPELARLCAPGPHAVTVS